MARIKYKEAVGLEAKRGKPSIGEKPGKSEMKRLYIKESRSIREIAEILGCSKDMVFRSLKENGIDTRAPAKRSNLRKYKFSTLESGVKEKGLRGYARELGVA
ncbi:MAG TPA: hypothetical protein VMW46_02170 [Candidatus Desulfaltia sp.]|nr:hypothetical protein [Candidatus Desulfaltia sp.]